MTDAEVKQWTTVQRFFISIVGYTITIVGTVILALNERHTVCRELALDAAKNSVTMADCNKTPHHYEGKLVFLSCLWEKKYWPIQDAGPLGKVRGMCLAQKNEWMQCVKSPTHIHVKEGPNGKNTTTTYSFRKEYHDEYISDESYRYRSGKLKISECGNNWNRRPSSLTEVRSRSLGVTGGDVVLNQLGWSLSQEQVDELVGRCDEETRPEFVPSLKEFYQDSVQPPKQFTSSNVWYEPSGKFHTCHTRLDSSPIGCLRFKLLTKKPPRGVAILSRVVKGRFKKYVANEKSKMCSKTTVSEIMEGEMSYLDFFQALRSEESLRRWATRFAGFVFILCGTLAVQSDPEQKCYANSLPGMKDLQKILPSVQRTWLNGSSYVWIWRSLLNATILSLFISAGFWLAMRSMLSFLEFALLGLLLGFNIFLCKEEEVPKA